MACFTAWRWAVLGAVVLATYLGCRLTFLLAPIDLYLLRCAFATRASREPPAEIVLVTIPNAPENSYLRPLGCTCPLIERSKLARAVDLVSKYGAKAVVLDLVFDNSCRVHDDELSKAMRRAGNIVVALRTVLRGEKVELSRPVDTVTGYRVLASPALRAPHGVVMAVNAIQGTWHRAAVGGEGESVVVLEDVYLPLGVAAAAVARGRNVADVEMVSAELVRVGGFDIPTMYALRPHLLAPFLPIPQPEEGDHVFLINWWGRPGRFPVVPINSLLKGKAPAQTFHGAVVIIGASHEEQATPFGAMTGLEIQANVVGTVLAGRWARPLSAPMHWLLIGFCATLGTVLITKLKGFAGALSIGSVLVLTFMGSRVALAYDRWLMAAPLMFASLTAGTMAGLLELTRQRHEARQLAAEMDLRDRVASEIVDDIRGHLTIISAMVDRLLQHLQRVPELQVDPEVTNVIRRQLKALDAQASALLDADPERQLRVRARLFPLRPLVEELVEDLRASSPRHVVHLNGQDVELMADPELLRRALFNILSNAVKYSPQGGRVDVEVSVDGDTVSIAVSDEGIGVPEGKLQALFQRFSRAVPEGVNIPGAGLGLYAASRAVAAHGGRIDVHSVPGAGSTFVIRLPKTPAFVREHGRHDKNE